MMLTASGVCMCARCEARTKNIYRMVGTCSNCGAKDVLMLFRSGDKAVALDCPVCGNSRSVHPLRLARDDEIPADLTAETGGTTVVTVERIARGPVHGDN